MEEPNAWRAEALRVGSLRPRHAFALGVHLGRPGAFRVGLELSWLEVTGHDAGLRFDLVDALVGRWRLGRPAEDDAYGWLTRPGAPEPHDVDHGWHAAFVRGAGAHELALAGFRVVTRTGWYDVVTAERRVWRRLRRTPAR